MSSPTSSIEAVSVTPTRSTFVTVLAWLSIVGSGFVTFISAMQAAMFLLVFRDNLSAPNRGWPGQEQLPAFLQFIFSHPEVFFVAFWSLAVLTLIASIGLLRRRNWGRLGFIAVLIFGCVWNLSGIWVQQQMRGVMPAAMRNTPSESAHTFELATTVASVGATVIAIAITVLFVWIIKRLLSPAVKAEFNAP